MASNDRFARGKARLMQHEQIIIKERTVVKRMGQTLPEDSIKIPKIGEWNLSVPTNYDDFSNTNIENFDNAEEITDDSIIPHQEQFISSNTNSPLKKNRQFPKSVPMTRAQTRHSGISSRIPRTTIQTANKKTRDNSIRSNSGLNHQTPAIPPPYLVRPPRVLFNDTDPLNKLTVNPPGTYSTDLEEIVHSKYRSSKLPLPPLKTSESEMTSTVSTAKTKKRSTINSNEDSEINDNEINSINDNTLTETQSNLNYEAVPPEMLQPSFLPLETFDDASYEEYPLNELLKDPHAMSKYNDNGVSKWMHCKILHYDEKTKLFLIEWDKNQKRKKVPRFNLRFDREDPVKFQERIAAARRNCARNETAIRFESRISQMPIRNLPHLAPEDIANIHSQIGISIDQKYYPNLLLLDAEVEQDFKLNNNRIAFSYEIEHNPMIPNRDEFIEYLYSDSYNWKSIGTYTNGANSEFTKNVEYEMKDETSFGLVERWNFNINSIIQKMSNLHLLANPKILEGLLIIWGIFQDSVELTLLTDGFNELLSLDDFVEKELNHLKNVSKNFKDSIQ